MLGAGSMGLCDGLARSKATAAKRISSVHSNALVIFDNAHSLRRCVGTIQHTALMVMITDVGGGLVEVWRACYGAD